MKKTTGQKYKFLYYRPIVKLLNNVVLGIRNVNRPLHREYVGEYRLRLRGETR
jgi:hypothetical protein